MCCTRCASRTWLCGVGLWGDGDVDVNKALGVEPQPTPVPSPSQPTTTDTHLLLPDLLLLDAPIALLSRGLVPHDDEAAAPGAAASLLLLPGPGSRTSHQGAMMKGGGG
jgi:hypothetical protein